MSETLLMREVEPFNFFIDCESAIGGLGGQVVPSDPNYCFHTHYHPVRPGPAVYRMVVSGARSTMGEITVRIHAHRADAAGNALYIGGSRLEIGHHDGDEISLAVRFHAARDYVYAYYGFLTEPSDIVAKDLKVTLEELDEVLEEEIDPFAEQVAVSSLASRAVGVSASQASALVLSRPATLDIPVSQDCTIKQLRSREFQTEGQGLTDTEALRLWSEIVCRQALIAYSAIQEGVQGLLIGGTSPRLQAFCEARGVTLREIDWKPIQGHDALAQHGHVDFLVSLLDIGAVNDATERYKILSSMLSRLMMGGLAIVCVRYVPDSTIPSSTMMSATGDLGRNEIGQWALRLIGSGLSVAPLAFAGNAELVRDETGHASLVLVIRRL